MTDRQTVFTRAILGVGGGPMDRAIVRLSAALARPSRAELVAVHVVEMDWTLPLDPDLAAGSEDAQRALDRAEEAAEDAGSSLETVLLQARNVGAAIVDEAAERGADLIVLGLPYRTRFGGDFDMSRTVPYVLKNASCAVWVVRQPIPSEET